MFRQLTFFFLKQKKLPCFKTLIVEIINYLFPTCQIIKLLPCSRIVNFPAPVQKSLPTASKFSKLSTGKKKRKGTVNMTFQELIFPTTKSSSLALIHITDISKKKKSTLFWAFLTSKVCRSGGVEWAQQESKTVEPHLDFFCYRV